jgi:uncharacterized delta-60 repeat protein
VQPDGAIVVAGHTQIRQAPGLPFENDFAVARYEPDGDLDLTFSADGKATTEMGTEDDIGNDVALDGDGRIVVGGELDQARDFGLVRYEPDGDVDPTFGPVVSDFGGPEVIRGVAVRPDGSVVIVGHSASRGDTFDIALAFYDENGRLDGDLVTTDVAGGDDFGEDLVLQPDGKIVVIGRGESDTLTDLALVRYTAAGQLDPSFDGDGMLIADVHAGADDGHDVALQADGRIVATGESQNGLVSQLTLLRALP